MHIVIIPAFFQTKKRPTLGSFFLEQAKALKQAGHKVSVLYCDTYSIKCIGEWLNYHENTVEEIEGISIYRNKCFCPVKHGMEGHKEAFARGIEQLWKEYLLKEKVDVIHAHCAVWAGYAAMKISGKTQVPYVVTEHATLFQLHRDEISQNNYKVIKQVFQEAGKVIGVSKAFAEVLSEYRTDIDVIGNVVDCQVFQLPDGENNKRDSFRFLTICYMQEEAQLYKKGMDLLLKAWKNICKNYPKAILEIGGDGPARRGVEQWCEEYGISNQVSFLGALSRRQVAEKMRECDCFVLPSRYETFGVVYIEAFASGKPVIATRNGGPDEFVKDFNGKLIENENVEALEKAMAEMLKGIEKYDAQAIRKYVEDNFSEKAIARKIEEVYLDTINSK